MFLRECLALPIRRFPMGVVTFGCLSAHPWIIQEERDYASGVLLCLNFGAEVNHFDMKDSLCNACPINAQKDNVAPKFATYEGSIFNCNRH
eukprot:10763658-Karenia_brevis.AAC.1